MGAHLSNASKKYNDARQKIGQFKDRLNTAAQREQIEFKEEVV